MTGSQRDAINILMMMESVTVNADLIAQALGMNPGVLRKHVRDGEYHISKYEICNDRIRFFRKDFLQKIGEMPLDLPERTEADLLEEIIELIRVQNTMLMEISAYVKKDRRRCNDRRLKGRCSNEQPQSL